MMEKLQFKVLEYEGPLDLILQLIAKHKLNIYDIEISALLEQYMKVMDEMQRMQLDIASEFLEMASRLVYIKSVMLLPRHEEEGEEKRRELTGELLEYQACKRAAALLEGMQQPQERHVREPIEIAGDMLYTRPHSPQELLRAYFGALGRGKRRLPPPGEAFTDFVARRVVSVSSRIAVVLKHLYSSAAVGLRGLFAQSADRPEMVATFLAVLELIKDKRARLSDDGRQLSMVRGAALQSLQELDTADKEGWD